MKTFLSYCLAFAIAFLPYGSYFVTASYANEIVTTQDLATLQADALLKAQNAQKAAEEAKKAAEAAQKAAIEAQEAAQLAINAAQQAALVAGVEPTIVPMQTLGYVSTDGVMQTGTQSGFLSGFQAGVDPAIASSQVPERRPVVVADEMTPEEEMLAELQTDNKGWNAGKGIRIVPHGAITIQSQMSENLLSFSKRDDNNVLGRFNQFSVSERIQLGLDILTSETSKFTLMIRSPSDALWGNDNRFAGSNYPSIKIGMFEYTHPETKFSISAGKQYIGLPRYALSASPIMSEFVPAVQIKHPVNDQFSYYAVWSRPLTSKGGEVTSGNDNTATSFTNLKTTYDFFSAGFTYTPDKKLTLTPWAAYAHVGKDLTPDLHQAIWSNSPRSEHNESVWWLGLTSNYKYNDKIAFGLDLLYNDSTYDDFAFAYLVDAYLTYKLNNGLITTKAWYASGDSSTEKGNIIAPEAGGGWSVGNSAYFDNSIHALIATSLVYTPTGLTGIGIGFSDYKPFGDKLSLGTEFTYMRGTNSAKSDFYNHVGYLTTNDSILELGAHARYQLSESIMLTFQANYLIPFFDKYSYYDEDASTSAHQVFITEDNPDLENAWRLGIGARYTF